MPQRMMVSLAALLLTAALASVPARPNAHALVVGVGTYSDKDSFSTLKADADAEAFAAAIEQLADASVTLLTNGEATRDLIGFWFRDTMLEAGDVVYIYLAGHGGGLVDQTGREAEIGAFFPYDARGAAGWRGNAAQPDSAITERDLLTWILKGCRNCDVVVFIDACRSALIARTDAALDPHWAVRGEGALVPRSLVAGVRDPEDTGRTFVFASSSEFEPAFEDPQLATGPYGLFTRCLLLGLTCDADGNSDGSVTFRELSEFLTESMERLSRGRGADGLLQTPVSCSDIVSPESDAFPIARTSCDLRTAFADALSVRAAGTHSIAAEKTEAPSVSDVASFDDLELERAVRRALDLTWEAPILRSRCEEIRQLIVPNRNIRSLAGIGNLAHLEGLDVRWNEVRDFTPLGGLQNLTRLDISSNQIEDVTALRELRRLTHVNLGNSRVDNVTAMLWLTRLASLTVSGENEAWIRDLIGRHGHEGASMGVTGDVVLEPDISQSVLPGQSYTFRAHIRMTVIGKPVIQIVSFVTQRSCWATDECSRVVFAEELPPGEHSITVEAVYTIPVDAEPGRIIWFAFDIEFAPHSGWVVGASAPTGE